MGVGFGGVSNYSNTTGGGATGVVATNSVGGLGVVVLGVSPPPPSGDYITTESGDRLITESGDYLVT